MKIFFSEFAAKELDDAEKYLELEFAGLGNRFVVEVRAALDRISRHPYAWPIERGEIRRVLLQRFPYKILYSVEEDHIFIVAIAHQHREPEYWTDRE